METIGLVIYILGTIVSLVCLIIVMIQMADIHGWLLAILGFCFCQLAVYLWGWISWKAPEKMMIMLIWTGGILGSIVGSLLASSGNP